MVGMENEETQDPAVPRVNLVCKVFPDFQETRESVGSKDLKDPRVTEDPVVWLVTMVHPVCLEYLVRWAPEDFLVPVAFLVYLVHQVFLEPKEVRVPKAMKDLRDLLDLQGRLAARDPLDLR